jgi:hypothetical protein
MGPMTGRAAGYCAGPGMPGYVNPVLGRGFGTGFGRGRGFWCRGFGGGGWGFRHGVRATGVPGWMRFGGWTAPYLQPEPEFEKETLKVQAEALQFELDLIKKRLSALDAGAGTE